MERTDTWKQIADDHAEVRAAMRRIDALLEGLCAGGDPAAPERLLGEVDGLRALLQEHFRLEERDEYLGTSFLDDPFERGRIDQLILQHRRFLARLDAVLQELRDPATGAAQLGALASDLGSLFSNIRWHDSVESGLFDRLGLGR